MEMKGFHLSNTEKKITERGGQFGVVLFYILNKYPRKSMFTEYPANKGTDLIFKNYFYHKKGITLIKKNPQLVL